MENRFVETDPAKAIAFDDKEAADAVKTQAVMGDTKPVALAIQPDADLTNADWPKRTKDIKTPRLGFTLVELLIVLTFIIALVGLFWTAVVSSHRNSNNRARFVESKDGFSFRVIELDGCEYFYGPSSGQLCHKGNCSNPIHKYNIEQP